MADWRVIAASVRGESHGKTGQPCQDACEWLVTAEGVLVGAVADGAGTAEFGDVGAQVATRAALAALSSSVALCGRDPSPTDSSSVAPCGRLPGSARKAAGDETGTRPYATDGERAGAGDGAGAPSSPDPSSVAPCGRRPGGERETAGDETGATGSEGTPPEDDTAWQSRLRDCLAAARSAVEAEAAAREVDVRQLATTLIVVAAAPDMVAAAQVGDGAAVVRDADGNLFALTAPQQGEYLNETTFLISPDALDAAQVQAWRGSVGGVAAFSDGLQMVALKMPEAAPHAPFFAPLFRFVSAVEDEAEAREQLAAFLRSPRIAERTDDDRTLLLAAPGR